MSINKFVLSGLTVLSMASAAIAGGRNPGSLLLYPEFDNRQANLTLLTVTNTDSDTTPIGNQFAGSCRVEFIYIGKYSTTGAPLDCLEFNRTALLTPNDTLTLITSAHNPAQQQGYVYVFAEDQNTGVPIVFNHLIGNLMTIQGIQVLDYSMNPVAFKGIGNGVITNLNGDNNRDLDGLEYEGVADELYIPRFLGQGGSYNSDLILIGLSGGTAFDTIVNFWIYNDNEEAFSAQYQFRCWDRVPLLTINGVFAQSFLVQTNQNPLEIIGATTHEAGWFKVYGQTAFSSAEQITDPAIYAVLIEKIANHGAADLPFESVAQQTNGSLLPRGIFGAGNPPVNGDNR